MEDVARDPRLGRRGTRWYFRYVVPADVRKYIGKREIKKSLGSDDK